MSNLAAENAVAAFFKNPLVAKAVVNQVIRKKPAHWGKKSNVPYYSERFARDLQVHIDAMLTDKQDRIFLFEAFPNLKPKSVYLRINQSLLFLVDELDTPDFKYTNFKAITILKQEKLGVRMTFHESVHGGEITPLQAIAALPQAKTYIWKEQVDEFLESNKKTELHIDHILLQPEQQRSLEESLVNLTGIIYVITATSIKIIKTNET